MANQVSIKLVLNRGDFDKQMSDATAAFKKSIQDMQIAANVNITAGAQQSIQQLQLEIAKLSAAAKTQAAISRQAAAEANRDGTIGAATAKANAQNAATESKYRIALMANETAQLKAQLAARTAAINADVKAQQSSESLKRAELVATSKVTAATLQLQGREAAAAAKTASAESTAQAKIAIANASLVSSASRKQASDARALLATQTAEARLALAERKANDAAALASQKASLAAQAQAQRDAAAQIAQLARDAIAQTKLQQSTVQNATAQTRLEQERVAAAAKVAAEQLKLQNAPNIQAAANAKQQLADTRANSAQLVANANITRAEIIANAQLTTAGIRQQMQQQRLDARAGAQDVAASLYLIRSAWQALTSVLAKPLNLSDEYVRLKNKLSIVTDSAAEATGTLNKLMDSANNSRTAIAGVTTLYSRMSLSLIPMGKSQQDIVQIAENVSKALQLGGATAAEAAGSIIQLSQAFDLGKLSGQEYRSVASMMPVVADAIRHHMGLSRAEMLKAAKEGKITAEVMAAAILGVTDELNSKFAQSGVTFAQAFNVMGNKLTDFLGKLNESIGLTQGLSKGIIFLSDNLRGLAVVVAGVGAGFLTMLNTAIFAKIAASIKGLFVALAANPFILVAASIAAATAALVLYSDEIKLAETTTTESLKTGERQFLTLADAGRGAASVIKQAFIDMFASNSKAGEDSADDMVVNQSAASSEIVQNIKTSLDVVQALMAGLIAFVVKAAENSMTVVYNMMAGVQNLFVNAVEGIVSNAAEAVTKLVGIADIANKISKATGNGSITDSIVGNIDFSKYKAEYKKLGEGAGDSFTKAFDDSLANGGFGTNILKSAIEAQGERLAAEREKRRVEAESAAKKEDEDAKNAADKLAKERYALIKSLNELEIKKSEFIRSLALEDARFAEELAKKQFEQNKIGLDALMIAQIESINLRQEANKQARKEEMQAIEDDIKEQVALIKSGSVTEFVGNANINKLMARQIDVELKFKIGEKETEKALVDVGDAVDKITKEAKAVVLQIRADFDKVTAGGFIATIDEIQKKYDERLESIKKFAGLETMQTEEAKALTEEYTNQARAIRDQELALNTIASLQADALLLQTELDTKQVELDGKRDAGAIAQRDYANQSYAIQNSIYTLKKAELDAELLRLQTLDKSLVVEQKIANIKKQKAENEAKKPLDEAQKSAKDYADWINKSMLDTQMTITKTADMLGNGFGEAISGVITKTKTAKEAIKDMGRSFLTVIAQMIAKQLALNFTIAIMGKPNESGGTTGGWLSGIIGAFTSSPTGYAGGGHVKGAGTSTSDSIPAMLSNGEYVMPAKATQEYGTGFLDMMRDLKLPKRKFNSGGLATLSRSKEVAAYNNRLNGVATQETAPQVTITMVNNGTPQKATDQNVTYDKIKGMMVTLFTDDLRNNGQMAQSINSAPSLRSTRR